MNKQNEMIKSEDIFIVQTLQHEALSKVKAWYSISTYSVKRGTQDSHSLGFTQQFLQVISFKITDVDSSAGPKQIQWIHGMISAATSKVQELTG